MVTTLIEKVKPDPGGGGGTGDRGGGRGNRRGNKRIKTNPGGDGGGGSDGDGSDGSGGSDGGGGGSGGGSANPHVRAGECPAPPSDLVLVGRIVDPAPTLETAAGGKMLEANVETWMTDLYRSGHWWIELPNVEDVSDVNRGRLMINAVCLGFTGSSLVSAETASQGRMRLEGVHLALFGGEGSSTGGGSGGGSSGWEMISGTPPAWFAQVWNRAVASCPPPRWSGDSEPEVEGGSPSERDEFANEFKNAKVYLSQAQVLQQQRDWLLL
ncbi:hypothetical protein ACHAXT_003049 [Thalassiosira profunda]